MQCPNCGQALPDRDTICPFCGWEAPSEAVLPEQEPEAPAAEDVPVPAEAAAEEAPAESAEPAESDEPEETAGSAETTESDAPEETAGSAEPAEAEEPGETAEESGEAEETDGTVDPAEAGEDAPDAPAKKRSVLPAVLGAIVALLAIIVVCLTVTLTTLSKTGQMPAFVTSIQNFFHREHFDADAAALRVRDSQGQEIAVLNNEQFSFYYWGEVYYFLQTSGMAFDPAQPLGEQEYMDGQTWQDFFQENAATSAQQVEAVKAEAAAAGYTMPDTYQEEYETILASMTDYAKQAGFTDDEGNGDVLAYVKDSYGSAATVESFEQYLYDSYYVTAYSDQIFQQVTVDDAALDSWYDENAEMYESYGILKSDQPNVNVRHILIAPAAAEEDATEEEIQKSRDEAKAEAERILKEWQDGDATEESFGELAGIYSTDGGSSSNGGLYENVYPGQMVESFNDWCFDKARKAGDTGIVESDYGYHIIYYVGATENYYWKQAAESDLHYKLYDDALQALVDGYSAETADSLELSTPTAISTLADAAAGNGAG